MLKIALIRECQGDHTTLSVELLRGEEYIDELKKHLKRRTEDARGPDKDPLKIDIVDIVTPEESIDFHTTDTGFALKEFTTQGKSPGKVDDAVYFMTSVLSLVASHAYNKGSSDGHNEALMEQRAR